MKPVFTPSTLIHGTLLRLAIVRLLAVTKTTEKHGRRVVPGACTRICALLLLQLTRSRHQQRAAVALEPSSCREFDDCVSGMALDKTSITHSDRPVVLAARETAVHWLSNRAVTKGAGVNTMRKHLFFQTCSITIKHNNVSKTTQPRQLLVRVVLAPAGHPRL
jgi:hypothetical protein